MPDKKSSNPRKKASAPKTESAAKKAKTPPQGATGPDLTGNDMTGPAATGSDLTGPAVTGTNMTGDSGTGDSGAGPDDTVLAELFDQMRSLEAQLDAAMEETRKHLRYRLEQGRAVFEEQVLARHREMKTKLWPYIKGGRLSVALTAPVIYGMIVPIAFLDVCVSLYQAICFPVYGIRKVRRGDYIFFDREHLAYLNALEKLNCGYCTYGNGVFAYVREVGARTEQYWCPIKHAKKLVSPHDHYRDFFEFGDAEAYRKGLEDLRKRLGE